MTATNSRRIEKSANAYRSIGEAADELGLQTHVLRYWETKFSRYLKPLKRPDGRRLFRPQDMEALRAIQTLVHDRGMTLKGAARLLNEQGIDMVLSGEARISAPSVAIEMPVSTNVHGMQKHVEAAFVAQPLSKGVSDEGRVRLETMLSDLSDLKRRLDEVRLNRAA